MVDDQYQENDGMDAIAIVGMALRVPGATDLDTFWHNLRNGVESIHRFSDDELRTAGVPESVIADPLYVKAFAVLEGAALFDAGLLDLSPREAEILDPQHRQLLQCSWEALEHAGCGPGSAAIAEAGRIGLYSGVGLNSYLIHNLMGRRDLIETLGTWQISLANDKDFATTRVAYKLDLRGPAVNVNTACSTSLVAVAMGCQSLLAYQCDLVLAGGCSVHLPQDQGYDYHPGGTLSPDGHCRAFDAEAQGTLDGNGVAMVALKRLDDALRDGDTVHAVIRGYAINNDGANKVGYTAPSVEGQAAVIREAQEMAGVAASSIGYVETHGTGTDLGDLVEISALTEAFRGGGAPNNQQCALGSVKTNIGHLDSAAGTASLIKTVLGLRHGQIPPSLHFKRANPKLGLETSPFHVNARLADWPRLGGAPRRAGVSSFGIGGTNAHVVVEEAPNQPPVAPGRPCQVLPISGFSEAACRGNHERLSVHLVAHPDQALADVAFTLQTGRRAFRYRQARLTRAGQPVTLPVAAPTLTPQRAPTVVFMLPGQDAQFPGMAATLYRDEPLFRTEVERCAEILQQDHSINLHARLFSPGGAADPGFATDALPLFVLEYALAQFWLKLGIQPTALLGYSLGEYVCACLSGVMTLEEALTLEVAASKLLHLIRPGALLAVTLSEAELRPQLDADLEIAMVMAPRQSVVGGEAASIAALQQRLEAQGVITMLSPLDLPFHTSHMDPFLPPYREAVRKIRLQPPKIPYISSVTGDWITPELATNPEYFLQVGRNPVNLVKGLQILFSLSDAVLLEVGPSQTMASLAMMTPGRAPAQTVLASLGDPRFMPAEKVEMALAQAMARLWTLGVDLDWAALYSEETRRRMPLPTYAFDYQRYWLAPVAATPVPIQSEASLANGKLADLADWFYVPLWQEQPALPAPERITGEWLLVGGAAVAEALGQRLQILGASVERSLPPTDGWSALLDARIAAGRRPDHIVYLGLLDRTETDDDLLLEAGYQTLVELGQAVGRAWFSENLQISVVGSRLFPVGDLPPQPACAAVLGPLRVLPQEYPNVRTAAIDLAWPAGAGQARQIEALVAELTAEETAGVALRHGRRWREVFQPHPMPISKTNSQPLRPGGVYLITGGLGNVGLTLARRIAERAPGAHLLLTRRRPMQAGDPLAAAVAGLRDLGAEVRVATADATDGKAMAALFTEVETTWGPLTGVIHAAGMVGQGSFATVSETTRDFSRSQIAPKLAGARVLENLLGERPLDFCLLCSSLSPILGGLGFTGYAAGNACLDSFVAAHNMTHSTPWLSVNWEGWRFDEPLPESNAAGAAVAELGLTAEEGATAFERILAYPSLDRIVMSTASLAARIRQWVAMEAVERESGPAIARHARPALLGAFVAPAGATQIEMARFWERLLGIDSIGAEDSFFELGGNSLLLTQLLAQFRRHYQLELSLASLFERPTIAAMAELIDGVRAAEAEREEGEL